MIYNRVCPICGKCFYFTGESWVYRKTLHHNDVDHHGERLIFCSWGCMRKYEKLPKQDIIKLIKENKKDGFIPKKRLR